MLAAASIRTRVDSTLKTAIALGLNLAAHDEPVAVLLTLGFEIPHEFLEERNETKTLVVEQGAVMPKNPRRPRMQKEST